MQIRNQLITLFKQKIKSPIFWLEIFILTLFFLAFLPVLRWFAIYTFSEIRIFHSLLTLLIAIILLFRYENPNIIDALSLNIECKKCLLITFFLALVFFITKFGLGSYSFDLFIIKNILNLLLISAMTLSLTSIVYYMFGRGISRITYSSSKAFILFFFISLFMIEIDWPLRTLAANWSFWAIDILGFNADIVLLQNLESQSTNIVIEYSGKNFDVAAECNGFGIILNCSLLGLLLSTYKQHNFFETLITIIAALFIGFSFNILRITSIVLITPMFFNHYYVFHEIFGSFYYWLAFLFTWVLLKGPFGKKLV